MGYLTFDSSPQYGSLGEIATGPSFSTEFGSIPVNMEPYKNFQATYPDYFQLGMTPQEWANGTGGHHGLYDTTNAQWDDRYGWITPNSNVVRKKTGDWETFRNFALLAALATGGGAMGGAFGGAGAAGAAGAGGTTAGWGTAAEGLAAQEAGMAAADLAGWGGATTTGLGGVAGAGTTGLGTAMAPIDYSLTAGGIPSLSTYGTTGLAGTGAPMLSTYGMGGLAGTGASSLGTLAGTAGLTGSALAGSGDWLSGAKSVYDSASKANKIYNTANSLLGSPSTGDNMTDTNWSGMLGNLIGGAGTYLGSDWAMGNYSDTAEKLAKSVKFTPYAITSDIGRTYQDPVTGEMISSLASPFATQQQAMLGQVGANLTAAQADPMLAAQDAYQKMRQLSSFEEQQKQQELENRLLQQGMLGSTGGATRQRAMFDAINQNQVNQQLQSIGLGQQLTGNAVDRASKLWTGALQPTAAMANQMGQTGTFGNISQGGQLASANILNQANLGKLGLQSGAVKNLFGSPAFTASGQQSGIGGLVNQGVNWGANQVGNWLSGSTPSTMDLNTPATDWSNWGQVNTFGQTPVSPTIDWNSYFSTPDYTQSMFDITSFGW